MYVWNKARVLKRAARGGQMYTTLKTWMFQLAATGLLYDVQQMTKAD